MNYFKVVSHCARTTLKHVALTNIFFQSCFVHFGVLVVRLSENYNRFVVSKTWMIISTRKLSSGNRTPMKIFRGTSVNVQCFAISGYKPGEMEQRSKDNPYLIRLRLCWLVWDAESRADSRELATCANITLSEHRHRRMKHPVYVRHSEGRWPTNTRARSLYLLAMLRIAAWTVQ